MSFTRHALIRMQQRGIRANVLEDLLDFGRAAHDHRGAEIVFFDKAARRRIARERGNEVQTFIEYSPLLLAALLWAWSGV